MRSKPAAACLIGFSTLAVGIGFAASSFNFVLLLICSGQLQLEINLS
jgi:hypothetical protein